MHKSILHSALSTFNHIDRTLALSTPALARLLLTSPSYLFIHYKIGLSMGKPMGRHPHTHYIILNPKKGPKRGRDPMISASSCAPPLTAYRSPKNRSNLTKDPQNLVKGQHMREITNCCYKNCISEYINGFNILKNP
jgi:hypothetical protein